MMVRSHRVFDTASTRLRWILRSTRLFSYCKHFPNLCVQYVCCLLWYVEKRLHHIYSSQSVNTRQTFIIWSLNLRAKLFIVCLQNRLYFSHRLWAVALYVCVCVCVQGVKNDGVHADVLHVFTICTYSLVQMFTTDFIVCDMTSNYTWTLYIQCLCCRVEKNQCCLAYHLRLTDLLYLVSLIYSFKFQLLVHFG